MKEKFLIIYDPKNDRQKTNNLVKYKINCNI